MKVLNWDLKKKKKKKSPESLLAPTGWCHGGNQWALLPFPCYVQSPHGWRIGFSQWASDVTVAMAFRCQRRALEGLHASSAAKKL